MFLNLLFFIIGVFCWTFLEYMIHRFWGHTKKKNALNPFTAEHRRHHAEFDYFAPAHKKALAALVIGGMLTLLMSLPFGWQNGLSFSVGLIGMYLVYETIHALAHHRAPINAYGRWYRMHHFYHHFRNPKANHGVSSPLWDMVFGTYVQVDEVVVPSRGVPLPWLFDEYGQIKEEFSDDYRMAGRRQTAG